MGPFRRMLTISVCFLALFLLSACDSSSPTRIEIPITPSDTQAPVVADASIDVVAGATVDFTPTATDNAGVVTGPDIISCTDGVGVQQNQLSVPELSPGTTFTCNLSATDAAGNTGTGTLTGRVIVPQLTNNLIEFGRIVDATGSCAMSSDPSQSVLSFTTSTGSGVIDDAGLLVFNGQLDSELADEEILYCAVNGGRNIDFNDDGIIDESPTDNQSELCFLTPVSNLRNETVRATAISNLACRSLLNDIGGVANLASTDDIASRLDSLAMNIVGDSNQDSSINADDLLGYRPLDVDAPLATGVSRANILAYAQAVIENRTEQIATLANLIVNGQTTMIPPEGGSQVMMIGGQQVTLTIPAGAVDSGTIINVAPATSEQLAAILEDPSEAVLALDLQPSGLEFNQPLEFTLQLPADIDSSNLLLGLLDSNGAQESLTNFVVSTDESGRQQANFEVPHFSTAVIQQIGFDIEFRVPAELMANTTDEAKLVITRNRPPRDSSGDVFFSYIISEVENASVSTNTFFNFEFPDNQIQISRTANFSCLNAGRYELELELELEFLASGFRTIHRVGGSQTQEIGAGICISPPPAPPTVVLIPEPSHDLSGVGIPSGETASFVIPIMFPSASLDRVEGCTAGVTVESSSFSGSVTLRAPSVSEETPFSCQVVSSRSDDVPLGSSLTGTIVLTPLVIEFGLNVSTLMVGETGRVNITATLPDAVADGGVDSSDFEITSYVAEGDDVVEVLPVDQQLVIDTLLDGLLLRTNTVEANAFRCLSVGAFVISTDVSLRKTAISDSNLGTVAANQSSSLLQGECTQNEEEQFARVGGGAEIAIAQSAEAPAAFSTTVTGASTPETAVILDDSGVAVSLYLLPEDQSTCITTVPGVARPSGVPASENDFVAQFDCVSNGDGTDNFGSVEGESTFFTVPQTGAPTESEAITTVQRSANTTDTTAGSGFNGFTTAIFTSQNVVVRDEAGNTSPAFSYQPFQGEIPDSSFNDAKRIEFAVTISEPDGLNSQVNIAADAPQTVLQTLLYTSELEAVRLEGFVIHQSIPAAVEGNPRTLRMIPTELVQHIADNNVVVKRIAIVGRNEVEFPDGRVFPTDDTAPPPGAGVSITTTPEALVPQAVCSIPTNPELMRCTAGTHEALLSVNRSDEIATYNPITGDHIDFFLTDTQGGLSRTLPASVETGFKATQGPDNCVLYSDLGGGVGEGQLLLFNIDRTHMTGDAEGNLLEGSVSPLNTNAVPLLRGNDQATRVNSYYGFDFYSANGTTDWKLFVAVHADTAGNGFSDTTQLLRYDYALTGTAVLSNPVVIASDSNGIFQDVAVVGDRIYVTHALDGESDPIRVFQPDGMELAALVSDLTSPRQISATFDGGLAVVDFPLERVRIIDLATGATRREYVLGDGDNAGNDRLRGVAPLRNGDYLVSGLRDINRSVVNRYTSLIRRVDDGRSSEGLYIGRACLSE